MNGKELWPESHYFIEDASPTMECVRLALSIIKDHGEKQLHSQESGLLEFRETDVIYGDGALQLRQIPSMILPDESSHEQNRIESGSTINFDYDGAPRSNVHVLALCHGTSIMHGHQALENADEFSWRTVALIVIQPDANTFMPEWSIDLLDGEDGSELNIDQELHLLALLEALQSGLQIRDLADGTLAHEIGRPSFITIPDQPPSDPMG